MKINPLTLSFYDECRHLEPEYQAFHMQNALVVQRVAIMIAIFFYGLFGILDAYLSPEKKYIFWFIRYAVVCPFAFMVFVFTFSRHYQRFCNLSLFLMFILAGFGIDMMILLADPPASYSYYAGIILVLIYLHTCVRIRFTWGFWASWLIIGFYEIIAFLMIETPAEVLVNNNFFIVVGNIFCLLAGYSIERSNRENFYLNYILDIEKQEVAHKNAELEDTLKRQLSAEEALRGVNLEIERIVKERTRELQESRRKYYQLVEHSNDAILIAQDGVIVFSNRRSSAMLGYEGESLEKRSIMEFIHEDDRAMVIDRHRRRLEGDKELPSTYSFRIVTKGQAVLTVQLSTVIIDWEGRPATLNFLQDITDQKRLEELIVQNEKMMSVGGLAAGMAHEINNPLAGMIQNAQVIKNRLTKDIPANQETALKLGISLDVIQSYMLERGILQQLENISVSGRQAATIVDNMLSFSRKTGSEKSTQRLETLIEKAINLSRNDYSLKKKFDFKNVMINRVYDSDIPGVLCDENEIQQVLFNIIKNASEAMGRKDYSKSQPCLTFRLKKLANAVALEIEDNGPGMDDETRKRVFEPFFTTKRVDEGTGLGLSVSYFIIVDHHKGEMEVQSMPGRGTRFSIKLPC